MAGPYLKHNPVLKLLERGLKTYGDRISTEQLYDWLGVGLPATRYKVEEASRNVRAWLEQHPAIQKAILTEGVRRYAESDDENFNVYMYEVNQRLYGTNLPPDFGAWCMEQSTKATDSRVVEYFIAFASHVGLSLETQLEQAHGHRELQSHISKMITQRVRGKAKTRELRREEQSYYRGKRAARRGVACTCPQQ